MKDRIAKSVFWVVWSRGGVQVLSFVSTLVVARLLSPSDYGLMALAGIWTGTVAMLAEMGLGTAIVQFRDVDDRELNACFWLTMGVAVSAYCALYAAAPFIADWFASPLLAEVLRVAGWSLPLIAVRVVPDALIRKELEMDKLARADIASSLIIIPVMLTLAWKGAGVWALVVGTLVQAVVYDVLILWFRPWWPGFKIVGGRMRDILRYSTATVGANIGWAVYAQLDSVILGKLAGEHVLGFYSMAKQLAILPVTKVSVVVNAIALPVMANLQADRALLRRSFYRVFRLVACLTVPLCIGMLAVADDLIRVVLAEKWLPVIPVFQVFCVYALLHSLEVLLPPVLLARYRSGFLLRWTFGLLLIMPVPFWLGARWQGALGLALMWVTVYPVLMLWMVREALQELDLEWKMLGVHLRPIAVAALLMGVCVVIVRLVLPADEFQHHLIRLVLAVVVGAATYAMAMYVQGREVAEEFWEVARWVFQPRAKIASKGVLR